MKTVQRRAAGGGGSSAGAAHGSGGSEQEVVESNSAMAAELAEGAIQGGGSELPFLDRIQESFGAHDLSDARAHFGEAAESATSSLGAMAFAYGEDVAFSEPPDLFTAAHEAAHVVGVAGEAEADAVAERVVAGQSAADLLDRHARGPSSGREVRMRDDLPRKEVSGKAMSRLGKAQKAIDETERVLSYGGGNQWEDLERTNFNAYFRMAVMRDAECWTLDPSLYALANAYPEALTAAKAELAQGGNCGEHAMIAFDWLRRNASSENVSRVAVTGLDHAFVILGDLEHDSDADLVVSDPWPTAPMACTWEDHFAHTAERGNIDVHNQVSGDDADVKAAIAGGLSLSPKGQEQIRWAFDDQRTQDELKKGREGDKPWIWRHESAAANGRSFDYFTNEPMAEEQEAAVHHEDEALDLQADDASLGLSSEPVGPEAADTTHTGPEPVHTDPEPVHAGPEPVHTDPEPVRTDPEPVHADTSTRSDSSTLSDEEIAARLDVSGEATTRAMTAAEIRQAERERRIAEADAVRQAAIARRLAETERRRQELEALRAGG